MNLVLGRRKFLESLSRLLPLIGVIAVAGGCRRQTPTLRSSSDSQTATVTTSSTIAAQAPISAPASTSTSTGITTAPDTSPMLKFSSAKDSLCGEVAENGFRIPDSDRRAVAAQFGQPDSVRMQPAPNPHRPAQMDTVADVFYPGIRLHYWVVGAAKPYDILLEADISDNKYLTYPQLGIGATSGAIASALGDPPERTDESYSYSCALHVMSGADVTFHFAAGRVIRVDYRWEAD